MTKVLVNLPVNLDVDLGPSAFNRHSGFVIRHFLGETYAQER
jgi:hypothetical protein